LITDSSPKPLLKHVKVRGQEVMLEVLFMSKPTVEVALLSVSVEGGGKGTPLIVDVLAQSPSVLPSAADSPRLLLQPPYAAEFEPVAFHTEHAGHA
jgi:hypothetical protein